MKRAAALASLLFLSAAPALAQARDDDAPASASPLAGPFGLAAEPDSDDDTMAQAGQRSVAGSLPEPLKSWGGLRKQWEDAGVAFAFAYTADAMKALANGGREGSTYMGRLEGAADLDLEKLVGWTGATLHVGGYAIHGVGMSHHYLGAISSVSDLETVPALRLNDIWLEQKFGDKLAIKIGRMGADAESFFFTPAASLPVGGAFGWPPILAANLRNSGPAYPLAWPGVKIRYEANENVAFQAAVFDGDPYGPSARAPDERDTSGLWSGFRSRPFAIAEIQTRYVLPFGKGLAGQLRAGVWRHFGGFSDQRYDIFGAPLAAPWAVDRAGAHDGDWGLYVTGEQHVWRDGRDKGMGAHLWARVGIAPGAQNLISFYADGGVNFVGMIAGRPQDKFGLAASFAKIGSGARGADFDKRAFGDWTAPIRDYEAILQATWAAEVLEGFTLQPNLQYVLHPGASGAALEPNAIGWRKPSRAIVAGLRMAVKY